MSEHDDDLVPFDPDLCPVCHKPSYPSECGDGTEYRCGSCGRRLVAVLYVNKAGVYSFSPLAVEPVDPHAITHRQRNRARKNRRGW